MLPFWALLLLWPFTRRLLLPQLRTFLRRLLPEVVPVAVVVSGVLALLLSAAAFLVVEAVVRPLAREAQRGIEGTVALIGEPPCA